MGFREFLIGRPLKTEEEEVEQIGPAAGIPVLGLDALASSSYGPEAALTALIPLGLAATGYIVPITLCIVGLLMAVYFSYLQTIPAYPQGGGSYTVARENLGPFFGLCAAAALCLDYILNVAVAIAAGAGALVSAAPSLLPHTLWICLSLLFLLTIVNLRGIRTTGFLFTIPTYLFVAALAIVFIIGISRAVVAPVDRPVIPPSQFPRAVAGVASTWLLLHAFASGCTALTGIEAVSNAVPIFRKPQVRHAKITLTCLVLILAGLVAGVAFLSRSYGITATPPGREGYESILSQIISAVIGRGPFYYITISSIIAVLCLSANTSFADFPRVCRVLALDEYLPAEFAHRGRRLVYSNGIVVLSFIAGGLLVLFNGITDRLIPLFAIGAFSAFTFSQVGMVVHWWKRKGRVLSGKLILNSVGAAATAAALIIIIIAKFREGGWVVLVILPVLIVVFVRVRKYHASVEAKIGNGGPLDLSDLPQPIVVVPLKRLDGVGRKALRLALRLSAEVQAVLVLSESTKTDDLEALWKKMVVSPAEKVGCAPPKLVLITSPYREFFGPFLQYLAKLAKSNPERPIGVMVPEVVEKRWYHFLFRHRATLLKGLILMKGGPQLFVINAPWYVEKNAALPEPDAESVPVRVASA